MLFPREQPAHHCTEHPAKAVLTPLPRLLVHTSTKRIAAVLVSLSGAAQSEMALKAS